VDSRAGADAMSMSEAESGQSEVADAGEVPVPFGWARPAVTGPGADGLAAAVVAAAQVQGVRLPDRVRDAGTLMTHVADQIRAATTLPRTMRTEPGEALSYLLDADGQRAITEAYAQRHGAATADLPTILANRDELRFAVYDLEDRGAAEAAALARRVAAGTDAGETYAEMLADPVLRAYLPDEVVGQAIAQALQVNLVVVEDGQASAPGLGAATAPALFVGARDGGHGAYVAPVTTVGMARTPGHAWEFAAEAARTPAEMLRVARGIGSDMREGYGRPLETRLAGSADALELVRHLPVAAAAMETTLTDPVRLAPAVVEEQFHNLLRTLHPTPLAVTAALPDAAGALPTVASVVRAWAEPPPDPAALKPGQAAWTRGRLTMIGAPESWSSDDKLATTIADLAAPAGRPVVVIRGERLARPAPGAAAPRSAAEVTGNAELRALTGLLSRYDEPARDDAGLTALGRLLSGRLVPPVVVTTGESPALTTLLERQGVTRITRVPSLFGEAWQVITPDRTEPVATADRLTAELFANAAEVAGATVEATPAALAGWLAQPTWAAAGEYLAANVADLLQPAVKDALAELRVADPDNRELAAYQVVLDAAARAGGLGDPAAPGWTPPVTSNALGADGMAVPPPAGPVPPWFLLQFLSPLASYDLRRGWIDSVLQLLYSGQLTGLEVVALTRALVAADGTPSTVDHGLTNLKVSHAVATVLAMTPEQAAAAWSGEPFKMAQALLQSCTVTPTDRWLWVLRLASLRARLTADGLPGRFGPASAGEHSELLNALATVLSNC
jgi:hypothetical protein